MSMNIKPKMDGNLRPLPSVEDDERYRDEMDAFIARNRDALNASIRRGRKEVAEGKMSSRTIDDIIAEGRKKFGGS
jgi:antitoxin ParD1/3/4